MSDYVMRCPHCRTELAFSETHAPRQMMCSECRQWFVLDPSSPTTRPVRARSVNRVGFFLIGLSVLGLLIAIGIVYFREQYQKRWAVKLQPPAAPVMVAPVPPPPAPPVVVPPKDVPNLKPPPGRAS